MTPGFVDEIVFIDLLALFLAIVTVEIVWYVARKTYRRPIFLGLHLCDCSICNTRLFRVSPHQLRCYGYAVWLAAGVAANKRIVAASHWCSSFLYRYRSNGMAMVELA
jgi:uncharacterized RDD family membrane protein YckC